MRLAPLSLVVLLALVSWASGQVTDGQWTYIVEDGGATITRSTATGNVAIPATIDGYPVKKVGNTTQYQSIFAPLDAPWWSDVANTAVTSVTIPDGVANIGQSAFRSCYGLTAIAIPSTVTSIGDGAFVACRGLTSITIPNTVTSLGDYPFNGCASLTTAIIGNGVTRIGSDTFSGCTSLSSVTIPDSVLSIEDGAFSGCTSLPSITIPRSVVSVGMSAFESCTSLSSVTIPDSVLRIGNGAFSGCINLVDVQLPIRFITSYSKVGLVESDPDSLGVDPKVSADSLVSSLANVLATNNTFITNLAEAIKSANGIYGIATRNGLSSAIEPLATKAEITTAINEGKASGIASVTASPNTWSLFTTSQIQNMAIGDLVLSREVNGSFVLNYDIEQSEDLVNWTPYQALSLPLTGLPTDKAFIRIRSKQ